MNMNNGLPDKKERDIKILVAIVTKQISDLNKRSIDLIRMLEMSIPRMADKDFLTKKKRMSTVSMAMEYPRALLALNSVVKTLKNQNSINGLISLRAMMTKAEREWLITEERIKGTYPHPFEEWCAKVKGIQLLTENIRKGLSA
jgi:hypothetical protein